MSQKQSTTIILMTIVAVVCIAMACLAGLVVGRVGGRIASLIAGRRPGLLLRDRLRATPVQPRTRTSYAASITAVTPGSPADIAGLVPGDLILAIDGKSIQRSVGPEQILASYQPGDRIELTVVRAGGTREVQVDLGEKPGEPGQAYLGITYYWTSYSPSD